MTNIIISIIISITINEVHNSIFAYKSSKQINYNIFVKIIYHLF